MIDVEFLIGKTVVKFVRGGDDHDGDYGCFWFADGTHQCVRLVDCQPDGSYNVDYDWLEPVDDEQVYDGYLEEFGLKVSEPLPNERTALIDAWVAGHPPELRGVAQEFPLGTVFRDWSKSSLAEGGPLYLIGYEAYKDGSIGIVVSAVHPGKDYERAMATRQNLSVECARGMMTNEVS